MFTKRATSKDYCDELKVIYGSVEYALSKLFEKREISLCCSLLKEEGELTVTFLKPCNEEGKLFQQADDDVHDVVFENMIEMATNSQLSEVMGCFTNFHKSCQCFQKI